MFGVQRRSMPFRSSVVLVQVWSQCERGPGAGRANARGQEEASQQEEQPSPQGQGHYLKSGRKATTSIYGNMNARGCS
ncbi:hypothetical protein CaCOL14_005222 [Colletotrichum acutatum]